MKIKINWRLFFLYVIIVSLANGIFNYIGINGFIGGLVVAAILCFFYPVFEEKK